MQKVKIVASGRVQGVGFRYHTLMIAQKLGVTGQVKNMADGTVCILAQADQQTLFQFQKTLREGNFWIRVNTLDVQNADFTDFTDFTIKN